MSRHSDYRILAQRWANGKGQRADVLRAVLAELEEYERAERQRGYDRRTSQRHDEDLRTLLRDRDAYIKTLEEQLLPYLLDKTDHGQQEAMI